MKKLIFLNILIASIQLFAETNNSIMTTTTTAPPSEEKIWGVTEFRPSFRTQAESFHTENDIELGYRFTKLKAIFYRQEFSTNLYNPALNTKTDGMNLTVTDGYVKSYNYQIWKSENAPISLGYENRTYLPTSAVKRDAGMITAIRNYLWLRYQASQEVAILFGEVPVVHLYDRAGNLKSANPSFENKIELGVEYYITPKTKLWVPFKYSATKLRDFDKKASYNDQWVHNLTLYPEVTHALTPNLKLGVAYYTDNMVGAKFDKLTLDNAFKKGVAQMILQASL